MTQESERIKELEAESAALRRRLEEMERNIMYWGIIELAVRNQSVNDYMKHWEGRTFKAESQARAERERGRRRRNRELPREML